MERPTTSEIQAEALEYLAEYDNEIACGGTPYYHGRTAEAIADFLLEAKFSLVDEDCDWSPDFCQDYFDIAKAVLIEAGVPA